MVDPNKKVKVKKKKVPDINEYLKNNRGYYYDDKYMGAHSKLKRRAFNCNDFDSLEEDYNKFKGRFVREHIACKVKPEEWEILKKYYKPVTDQETLEMLRPALEWMSKYVFTEDENEEI